MYAENKSFSCTIFKNSTKKVIINFRDINGFLFSFFHRHVFCCPSHRNSMWTCTTHNATRKKKRFGWEHSTAFYIIQLHHHPFSRGEMNALSVEAKTSCCSSDCGYFAWAFLIPFGLEQWLRIKEFWQVHRMGPVLTCPSQPFETSNDFFLLLFFLSDYSLQDFCFEMSALLTAHTTAEYNSLELFYFQL